MSVPFNAGSGLVVIRAEIWGPKRIDVVRLALDTGASGTLVSPAILVSMGYDPAASPSRIQVTTANGVAFAPRLNVEKIFAMDAERQDFPVVAHTLPVSAGVDGLLGLDFLRGLCLTIDFRNGQLTLV